MKKVLKRSLAMVMALVLCLGILSGVSVSADAAGGWLYNWGTRGTVAGALSGNAVAFYADNDTSYELLSSYSGSSTVSGVPSSELYKELQELMESNHSYVTSYNATRDMYAYTDCQNGGGKISSFYSGKEIGPVWDSGATWNREHTWPNSKGDASGQGENDIMMLRPTAKEENGSRGNTAYGESSGYYNPNSVSGGTYNLHGDVARILLYVYVRWGNTGSMWGQSGVIESKEVLLNWMAEDPVDTWELGRNDVVESITGTRNVFVDYPELAFLLFNEEIPAGMVTPSGEAGSANTYTVNATANNDAYGSVSVSGKVITATPAAGYFVSTYEVTSGTATVKQSGNTFIVDASSDCTVQINFAPKATTSIFFFENGTMASNQLVYQGNNITLPGHTTTLPEGYTFVGWSENTLEATENIPTILTAGSSYTVNGNTKLYAIYSYAEQVSGGAESYVLVTSASQLYEGATVVIAAKNASFAMGTTQNKNNRASVAITKNSDGTITWTTDVQLLTLGIGGTAGTYTFYTGSSGYLYCASGSSNGNYLRTGTTLNDRSYFTISVSADGTSNIVSVTTDTDRNQMRFNSSNSPKLFACYKSGQDPLSLYIKTVGSGSVTYYTTGAAPTCQHINTTNVFGQAETCTENGWTDGLYCNDCQTYVNGHATLPATGHASAVWMNAVAATCNAYGTAGHWHCDVCGGDYWEKTASAVSLGADALRVAKDPNNHDADTEVRGAADATCTATGYSGDTYCLGCETKIASGQEIPMQAHTLSVVAASEATHEDDGNIEHYTCSVCEKYFADENGTEELTADDVVIPALGHNYGAFQKDKTKHWKECSCGDKSEEGAHTYGDWVTVTAATQTAKGSKERTCTACGHKQTAEIPVISSPATGDNTQLLLWTMLLLVSACGLVTVVTLKKRQRG